MTGDDDSEKFFSEVLIMSVNIPIFFFYMLLLWLVVKRIGIK